MVRLYDSIGKNYQRLRCPDPRIQTVLSRALDGQGRVLNVGAVDFLNYRLRLDRPSLRTSLVVTLSPTK